MKSLEVKQTELKIEAESTELANYLDLAMLAINVPPERGFTPEEMRTRIRILDVLESAKTQQVEEVRLEDADAAKLQDCVRAMRWPKMHRQILGFVDDVLNMAAPVPTTR